MKQQLAKNLIVEIDEDQVLHMTVDLKKTPLRSVSSGNPMACSTRTHVAIVEAVDGKLQPSGWWANVSVFKKGGTE